MDELYNIEFYRNAFCLVPSDVSAYHETILIGNGAKTKPRIFCSCSKGSYASCAHGAELRNGYEKITALYNGTSPADELEGSAFMKVMDAVARVSPTALELVHIRDDCADFLQVVSRHDEHIFSVSARGAAKHRLHGRLLTDDTELVSRHKLLKKAASFVVSEQEKQLAALGHKTVRQTFEQSIWYRLAYHCFREFDPSRCTWRVDICDKTGSFYAVMEMDGARFLRMTIPEKAVPPFATALQKYFPPFTIIDSAEADLRFKLALCKDAVEIHPVWIIRDGDRAGEYPFDETILYESMLYLKPHDRLVRLTYTSLRLTSLGFHIPRQVTTVDFSEYLISNGAFFSVEESGGAEGTALDLFGNGGKVNFARIINPPLIESFDRMEIRPLALDGPSCALTIAYVKGNCTVRLQELLETWKSRKRFLLVKDGLVDCFSPDVARAVVSAKGCDSEGIFTLPRAALLQMHSSKLNTAFTGSAKLIRRLKDMLSFKPARDLAPLKGLESNLRNYQVKGVQWLLFLYDNRFGGLLCDDMGLGKTHQALALLIAIKEQREPCGPFIVVCPTTVLPHWQSVIHTYAPSFKCHIYHGERALPGSGSYDCLITTYGVMCNDLELLKTIVFEVAVFDEVQQLKNAVTVNAVSAGELNALVKIGLTGTPIENSLDDLRNLFKVVMPGFLDSVFDIGDLTFVSDDESRAQGSVEKFRRCVSPFILRRIKSAVLDELPGKTEEIRTCVLSDEQHRLYNTAMLERGGPLLAALQNRNEPVPYMHIFSLFNFLKQVCDHPALVTGHISDFENYESGKFELFKELLQESLDSDQKVVVFSQYLDMIDIFGRYLDSIDIRHVTLTGATRDRKTVVERFAIDPSCKVFTGSLKAGGIGIDLAAASVVIHYDRWWNASKEDQASDRVHRIGQKRCVQIFKLVTETTVEDRISAIIDRKKILSESALTIDTPEELKSFSREEMIELLREAKRK